MSGFLTLVYEPHWIHFYCVWILKIIKTSFLFLINKGQNSQDAWAGVSLSSQLRFTFQEAVGSLFPLTFKILNYWGQNCLSLRILTLLPRFLNRFWRKFLSSKCISKGQSSHIYYEPRGNPLWSCPYCL